MQGELPDLASDVTMAVLWPCSAWSSPSCPMLIWVSAFRGRGVNKERRAPWASLGHVALVGRRYGAGLCWGMLGVSSPSPALTDAFAFPRVRLECQGSLVSR